MTTNQEFDWQDFQGANLGYVLELYEQFKAHPDAVEPAVRAFFQGSPPPVGRFSAPQTAGYPPMQSIDKAVAVANLAQSIRFYGHLSAQLDPLGSPPPGDPSLELEFHHLSEEDLRQLPAALVGGTFQDAGADGNASGAQNAYTAIEFLRSIYCQTSGYDYGHIFIPVERAWLREAAETRRFYPAGDADLFIELLKRLTKVEAFEQFLQRSFPGRTRFSIEGVDALVPMLDEIVSAAAKAEICMIFIGMAHRGRLNVLAHILQKPYPQLLAEFKDPGVKPIVWDELGWTGDVKYHKGASHAVAEEDKVQLVVSMPSNPSHLEHINPVIQGMARAAGSGVNQAGMPLFYPHASIPILIHGDASFPGQGVVTETLNLSHLDGYHTAGAIHVITNNQLGYTASSAETRSSPYASDFARGLKIPIIHVNADDPLACIEAARTAFAYREEFQKDFLIDLIGYRRYGHNEGDEPSFTQPVMYQTIHSHPTVRALWGKRLVDQGVIEPDSPDNLVKQEMVSLQAALDQLNPSEALIEPYLKPPPPGAARAVHTALPVEALAELNHAMLEVPQGFHINRKLVREREKRAQAFEKTSEPGLDWAHAEELALASILQEGIAIRLTGQDVARGTFSQRHAVLFDEENGQSYIPLHAIRGVKASFEVRNSPLSENAALGFEFGYNIQAPNRLVIWEAQYGDFINTAQAIIDEFISSARAKWSQAPSLVMLLPHGNEGQGPDHSSGRPERFLQMTADINMRVAIPTTAAQYFHLLRRQALLLKTDPLPLIVFTPKGMLRHPLTASSPIDLAKKSWQPVLSDTPATGENGSRSRKIRRLLLCSGRIYVDLVSSPLWKKAKETQIARLEQLYPFPETELRSLLESLPDIQEVIWVQEEPRNMGAWEYARPLLLELNEANWRLVYVGRSPSSSPAEGSAAWYALNQKAIIDAALSPEKKLSGESAAEVMVERE